MLMIWILWLTLASKPNKVMTYELASTQRAENVALNWICIVIFFEIVKFETQIWQFKSK